MCSHAFSGLFIFWDFKGWATTDEASEYLKKTLVRDLFVMSYGTRQSRKTMSLTVKITALWALKVPLELLDFAMQICTFSMATRVTRRAS